MQTSSIADKFEQVHLRVGFISHTVFEKDHLQEQHNRVISSSKAEKTAPMVVDSTVETEPQWVRTDLQVLVPMDVHFIDLQECAKSNNSLQDIFRQLKQLANEHGICNCNTNVRLQIVPMGDSSKGEYTIDTSHSPQEVHHTTALTDLVGAQRAMHPEELAPVFSTVVLTNTETIDAAKLLVVPQSDVRTLLLTYVAPRSDSIMLVFNVYVKQRLAEAGETLQAPSLYLDMSSIARLIGSEIIKKLSESQIKLHSVPSSPVAARAELLGKEYQIDQHNTLSISKRCTNTIFGRLSALYRYTDSLNQKEQTAFSSPVLSNPTMIIRTRDACNTELFILAPTVHSSISEESQVNSNRKDAEWEKLHRNCVLIQFSSVQKGPIRAATSPSLEQTVGTPRLHRNCVHLSDIYHNYYINGRAVRQVTRLSSTLHLLLPKVAAT